MGGERRILGDVSGDITLDQFDPGALLRIDGAASGAIHFLQDVGISGANVAEVRLGALGATGSLDIDGDLEGLVDINGVSSGTINVDGVTSGTLDVLSHSSGAITLVGETSGDIIIGGTLSNSLRINDNLTSTGSITVGGETRSDIVISLDCAGDITVGGALNGQIVISDNLTSTGSITVGGDTRSDIVISLDCAGDIILNGHLLGDVDITQDLTSLGSIVIDDSMKSTGRILVGGLIHGLVSVGTETVALSQIRAVGGLALNACIIINADEGAYDANGVIHLGPPIAIPEPPPPIQNDVTFDGGIKIFDGPPLISAGNLEGTITVTGCHATSDDLDICVDGSINGSITINQTGCTKQVTHSCVGNCP